MSLRERFKRKRTTETEKNETLGDKIQTLFINNLPYAENPIYNNYRNLINTKELTISHYQTLGKQINIKNCTYPKLKIKPRNDNTDPNHNIYFPELRLGTKEQQQNISFQNISARYKILLNYEYTIDEQGLKRTYYLEYAGEQQEKITELLDSGTPEVTFTENGTNTLTHLSQTLLSNHLLITTENNQPPIPELLNYLNNTFAELAVNAQLTQAYRQLTQANEQAQNYANASLQKEIGERLQQSDLWLKNNIETLNTHIKQLETILLYEQFQTAKLDAAEQIDELSTSAITQLLAQPTPDQQPEQTLTTDSETVTINLTIHGLESSENITGNIPVEVAKQLAEQIKTQLEQNKQPNTIKHRSHTNTAPELTR